MSDDFVNCTHCKGRGKRNLEDCKLCNGSGKLPKDVGVHWAHCYQSEYKGSCKYGDDDCPAKARRRYNYVGVPETLKLEQVVHLVNRAFGEICYQVGSSTERTTFRDVDVRMIMDDEKFDALFGERGTNSLFWSLMCASLSEYISKMSGLPVDFQIQRMTDCNRQHDGVRNAMGLFNENYQNERDYYPPWRKL